MKRAVVVYLDNKIDQLKMFRCLYASFKHIQSPDTDLVVFGEDDTLIIVPDDCIKVAIQPDRKFSNYPYIHSLACLAKKEADFTEDYDYLLRSDVDTFLTPAWNNFYPKEYTVGKGQYADQAGVKLKIKETATLFKLKHRGWHNIGSTHYGQAKLVRDVSRIASEITKHLILAVFKDTSGTWPGWYKGVSSMYALEIATNHLLENISTDHHSLDFPSTSVNSIHKNPHIHCWHTDQVFSKFAYLNGEYDQYEPHQLNATSIREYCLKIALEAKGIFKI
ncbi:hypothetical protein CIB95_09345 [Lottiidibacillus patelloidae]|uniref:DUF7164 domain-containing protein n=1 Tax=Lottiidibacillus patelloidae TaxID=2670334 RepID=A0A263BTF8_9BACI|nr:hypothetical protein [Lottiidibacillus patelloidae]OZM56965.1 hypothetical protein CIB95_09345 [Lottiidibacillus patelloidae]